MYCAWRIPAHLRCTQCSILLHLMDICFLTCICLWQISQIQTFLFKNLPRRFHHVPAGVVGTYRAYLLQQRKLDEMVHCLVCFFALARRIKYLHFFVFDAAQLCTRSVDNFHSDQVPDAPLARDSLSVLWSTDWTTAQFVEWMSWFDSLHFSTNVPFPICPIHTMTFEITNGHIHLWGS